MARFLNVPMRIDLGQAGNRLLLEPLLFQYAGDPVPEGHGEPSSSTKGG